jgi:hypothetical protein
MTWLGCLALSRFHSGDASASSLVVDRVPLCCRLFSVFRSVVPFDSMGLPIVDGCSSAGRIPVCGDSVHFLRREIEA